MRRRTQRGTRLQSTYCPQWCPCRVSSSPSTERDGQRRRGVDAPFSHGSRSRAMMVYKGYLARIAFDEQANLFHGEVINIRDVVTFQGQSVDELRQAFADSVEDYLAFCGERGEEPDQPFSGRFTVRLSPEQHRKVILAAQKAGKDVVQWVTETLEQVIG